MAIVPLIPSSKPRLISGLLLLNKPSGPTSHDAVAWVRRTLGVKQVGHCGTLDPMATGLLLMAVGEAVKFQDKFTSERKTYSGVIRLGVSMDTDDVTGRPLENSSFGDPSTLSRSDVENSFSSFLGEQSQRVPRYSAVKVNGRRLYELARSGISFDLPVKTVTLHRFDLISYASPDAAFFVECSKGTYIRSLARDVGEKLGTGGALASLCRESIGRFSRSTAFPWDPIKNVSAGELLKFIVPMNQCAA